MEIDHQDTVNNKEEPQTAEQKKIDEKQERAMIVKEC